MSIDFESLKSYYSKLENQYSNLMQTNDWLDPSTSSYQDASKINIEIQTTIHSMIDYIKQLQNPHLTSQYSDLLKKYIDLSNLQHKVESPNSFQYNVQVSNMYFYYSIFWFCIAILLFYMIFRIFWGNDLGDTIPIPENKVDDIINPIQEIKEVNNITNPTVSSDKADFDFDKLFSKKFE